MKYNLRFLLIGICIGYCMASVSWTIRSLNEPRTLVSIDGGPVHG